jgi:hypothetical protein
MLFVLLLQPATYNLQQKFSLGLLLLSINKNIQVLVQINFCLTKIIVFLPEARND